MRLIFEARIRDLLFRNRFIDCTSRLQKILSGFDDPDSIRAVVEDRHFLPNVPYRSTIRTPTGFDAATHICRAYA